MDVHADTIEKAREKIQTTRDWAATAHRVPEKVNQGSWFRVALSIIVLDLDEALAALAAVPVEGCVPPIGTPVPGGDQGSEPPLLAHPVGGTEPVNNNDAGRTTLDGRSAAGVEEKGA